mgnify:CR=1 FL=1|tara:strand:+ start:203 stop:730 length:528 start_codon:yes stop_codon:yes gene_type:complete
MTLEESIYDPYASKVFVCENKLNSSDYKLDDEGFVPIIRNWFTSGDNCVQIWGGKHMEIFYRTGGKSFYISQIDDCTIGGDDGGKEITSWFVTILNVRATISGSETMRAPVRASESYDVVLLWCKAGCPSIKMHVQTQDQPKAEWSRQMLLDLIPSVREQHYTLHKDQCAQQEEE